MELVAKIIDENKFTPKDVPDLKEKLFFEGAKRRRGLETFTVLLFLSAVIATYGILGDSVAAVIGAMIIAPLMRPIMGTTAGLVMGDMHLALRSFKIVVFGIALVIFTSWFISSFLNTTVIAMSDNSQIIGRISPSLTDLMIAIASGAAGAFALSRSDIADSLPGVAISISLVPPLCVAGIGLSISNFEIAWGAMLLFLTNFFAILLTGGGVFALLGLSAASMKTLKGNARKRAFTVVVLGMVLLAIPLAYTTYTLANETKAELKAKEFVNTWLDETNYYPAVIRADGNDMIITVHGSGNYPDLFKYKSYIDNFLKSGYTVNINVIESTRYIIE